MAELVPREWSEGGPVEKNLGGRPKGSTKYTPLQIDKGLLAIAFTGSYKEAAEQCKALGFSPNRETLRTWREKYAPRYAELYEQHRAEIEQLILSEYGDAIRSATDAVMKGIELTNKQFEDGSIRDAAGATRNMATVAAIYQDKINANLGRPTKIIQHRSDTEAIASLAKRHGMAVDGSAETDDS